MAELSDVMLYLLQQAGGHRGLPNGRLTKLVYLSDWLSSVQHGRQITAIQWYFDHFGPYVFDVVDTARGEPDRFAVRQSPNPYGSPSTIIATSSRTLRPTALTSGDRKTLDHVIETTAGLNWSEFVRLVYSTYPVLASAKYTVLDLPELAKRYRDSTASAPPTVPANR